MGPYNSPCQVLGSCVKSYLPGFYQSIERYLPFDNKLADRKGSRLSWQDLTDTEELLQDDENEVDAEDAAFIEEFDKAWDTDLKTDMQTASIKTVVDGIRRIAKVCNAQNIP